MVKLVWINPSEPRSPLPTPASTCCWCHRRELLKWKGLPYCIRHGIRAMWTDRLRIADPHESDMQGPIHHESAGEQRGDRRAQHHAPHDYSS